MITHSLRVPIPQLKKIGLTLSNKINYQADPERLIMDTINRKEGILCDTGALVIHTGTFTGRSPKDKFIVNDAFTKKTVSWNEFNNPIEPIYFDRILEKVMGYLNNIDEIWVRDAYACAHPDFKMKLRVVNELPAMNLFAHNLLIRPSDEELEDFTPDWHILSAPGLALDPQYCGTRQSNATVVSFAHKLILIVGSAYTGEIKKSVFTILNYLLPLHEKILSMHCAANVGGAGDTALFFGLSGTGKTTLSADPERALIGDDEHGWAADNVFNFEGGCYAKCIHLSEEKEPDIYNAITEGALVENVQFFEGTNTINFDDASITENTRVAYPLHFIQNIVPDGIGTSPKNIFFLTCDAYGILPPVSRLTKAQAMYYFMSGYTAKIAGTEAGITAPKSTFSACFGAPFIPLHPGVYAEMLGDKIATNNVKVWMINTGWTGGPYGTGSRINLKYSRAIIRAVLDGSLDHVKYTTDPIFGLSIPESCPNVNADILIPKNTWQDAAQYDMAAKNLASEFIRNFEKYKENVPADVITEGPQLR